MIFILAITTLRIHETYSSYTILFNIWKIRYVIITKIAISVIVIYHLQSQQSWSWIEENGRS